MAKRFQHTRVWLRQADCDLETARLLLQAPLSPSFEWGDRTCQVTAKCAQALEKGIKSYEFLQGRTPEMTHRAYTFIENWLQPARYLHYPHHWKHLSSFFDLDRRTRIRGIIDMTPGVHGRRRDLPNTEYPWNEGTNAVAPASAPCFTQISTQELADMFTTAERAIALFRKLATIERAISL